MTEPGPAQLELIRRYARTLREMHADAMAARGPRIGAEAAKTRRTTGAAAPIRQAAKQAMASGDDVAPGQTPTPAQ
jgi:hypothetical protein